MNCQIQEAGSDWLSTNERVALHHSVLIVQFQSSEVSRGAKLAQVLVLITQPFSSFPRRSLCRMNHHHVADHPLHEAWADAGRGPEPARGSGQRGPEAVRSVDPARGLERRPDPGSHRRRGVLDRDGGGCAKRPRNRRYTDARRASRRAADRGPQANHAADVSEAIAVRRRDSILFLMPGIAATLSSWSGGCGGGREAAGSAWYSSLPVPELPRQTCGLAAAGLAVLLARHQWQEASC